MLAKAEVVEASGDIQGGRIPAQDLSLMLSTGIWEPGPPMPTGSEASDFSRRMSRQILLCKFHGKILSQSYRTDLIISLTSTLFWSQ